MTADCFKIAQGQLLFEGYNIQFYSVFLSSNFLQMMLILSPKTTVSSLETFFLFDMYVHYARVYSIGDIVH